MSPLRIDPQPNPASNLPAVAAMHPEAPDFDAEFFRYHSAVSQFTMSSIERSYAVWKCTQYVAQRRIPGALVQAGIWRGGAPMLSALALMKHGDTDRNIYLFDTFEGMPPPAEQDFEARTGVRAATHPDYVERNRESHLFAYATRAEVERNMTATGYPPEHVHYIQGVVEETVPGAAPTQIAYLQLDTNWYRSTLHNLKHLWERIAPGGVLFIEDYGYWAGARQATDEFFSGRDDAPLLTRVDRTGRVAIKV